MSHDGDEVWRGSPTPWSRPCTGRPRTTPPGPLADRREDDIAVLLLRRRGRRLPDRHRRPAVAAPVRRTVLTVAQAEPERIAEARRQLREHAARLGRAGPGATRRCCWSPRWSPTSWCTPTPTRCSSPRSPASAGARRIRVEVTDGSDDLPHRRRPGELASSGRGSDADGTARRTRGAWIRAGDGKSHLVRALRGRGGRGGSGVTGARARRVVARSSSSTPVTAAVSGTDSSMPRMPATRRPR